METATWIILIMFAATSILIIGFGAYTLRIGSNEVFRGSGSPIAMAQMLLSSIHVTSQILLGVLIVTIISLLVSNKIISSESGLPVLSVISGYLLGKNFKDISFNTSSKNKPTNSN